MFPARHWILHLCLPISLIGATSAYATQPHCSVPEGPDGGVIIVPIGGHEQKPSKPGKHEEGEIDQGHHGEGDIDEGSHGEGTIITGSHGEGTIITGSHGTGHTSGGKHEEGSSSHGSHGEIDIVFGGHRSVDPEIILDPIGGHGSFANKLVHGKVYVLVSRHSGKCLDVAAHGTAPGSQLQQWDCHGKANQRFRAIEAKKGEFLLVGEESKLCTKIRDLSTCDGALAQLGAQCNSPAARLKVKKSVDGTVALSFLHSGKCLDISGPSLNGGAKAQQWACHGGDNQAWYLLQLP